MSCIERLRTAAIDKFTVEANGAVLLSPNSKSVRVTGN